MSPGSIGGQELRVLREVVARLDAAGTAYMLTGSAALATYTQPRMTRDLDLVVELAPSRAAELADRFEPDFLVNHEEFRRAAAGFGMTNLIHSESLVKVDFIIRKADVYRKMEFSRRRRARVDGVEVWTAAPEDLILSKLVWALPSRSELQLRDVRTLLALPGLDREYLFRWAEDLGVADLLRQAELP